MPRTAARHRQIELLEDRTLLTVVSAFDGATGQLSVDIDAADDVFITAAAGQVLVNGADVDTGVLFAEEVTTIHVTAAGDFPNVIGLSNIDPFLFGGLNSVTLEGGEGDDEFIVDMTAGALALPGGIHVFGGDGGNDLLTMLSDGAEELIYIPSPTTFGDGEVFRGDDNLLLTFEGLEPFDAHLSGGSAIMYTPNADDVIAISNFTLPAGSDALAMSGTSGAVAFEELRVVGGGAAAVEIDTTANTADGLDTIDINSASNAHGNASLSIKTGTGNDVVNVNGSVVLTGTLSIDTGGVIQGGGNVNAAVNIVQGSVEPGNGGSGTLTVGNTTFSANAAFSPNVDGTSAGTDHDQLKVNGTINLGGAALNVSGTIGTVSAGTQIVLIDNDGTDAVTGTFAGLPGGSMVTVNGHAFELHYDGGTGNDVVLTTVGVSPPTDVYVADDLVGTPNGTPIADANPDAAGNQPGTFGVDVFSRIVDGVSAVASGGTVHVVGGSYNADVSISKPLTLQGTSGFAGDVQFLAPASMSIVSGGDGVAIRHITIAADLVADSVVAPTLEHVIIREERGFRGRNLTGTLTVRDSLFHSTSTALFDIESTGLDVVIRDSTFVSNPVGPFSVHDVSSVEIHDVDFRNNSAGVQLSDIGYIIYSTSGETDDDIEFSESTVRHRRNGVDRDPLELTDIGHLTLSTGEGEDTISGRTNATMSVGIDAGYGPGDLLTIIGSAANDSFVAQRQPNPAMESFRVTNGTSADLDIFGIDNLTIEGLGGDDRLTIDESFGGLLGLPSGVTYHGGDGFDFLALGGSEPVLATYNVGPDPSSGHIQHTDGTTTQNIRFTGLEPVLDAVPGDVTIVANGTANSINLGTSALPGFGSVEVDGFERYEFFGKRDVRLEGGAGQDTFGVSNTNVGFSGRVVVDGGDPVDGDSLILAGTAGDDLFSYTPNPVMPSSGEFSRNGRSVEFHNVEDATVSGGLGNDSLTAQETPLGRPATWIQTTPPPAVSGARYFGAAFETANSVGLLPSFNVFRADGTTELRANADTLSPHTAAGVPIPDGADQVYLAVSSPVGRKHGNEGAREVELIGGVIGPDEFVAETEPNNLVSDDIAIIINNDHRVGVRGSVPTGDSDLISIIINNDHRIGVVINNDHRSAGGDDNQAGVTQVTHTLLEVLDTDGTTVLAATNRSMVAASGAVITQPLSAGTYFVRVTNGGDGSPNATNYEMVVFDVFNELIEDETTDGDSGNHATSPGTSFGVHIPKHWKGHVPGTPPDADPNNPPENGRDDVVVVDPLGNRESNIRYNNSTPLFLSDFESVTVDPGRGTDTVIINGTDGDDEFDLHAGPRAFMNQQPFDIRNTENLEVQLGDGADNAVTRGFSDVFVEINAGESHGDVLLYHGNSGDVVLSTGQAFNLIQENGILRDQRLRGFETVAVNATGANAFLSHGFANSVASITPGLDSIEVTTNVSDKRAIIGNAADIQIDSPAPTTFEFNGTLGDDTINVSSSRVEVAGLQPVDLNLNADAAIRINGREGADRIVVTPTTNHPIFIDGGAPIGDATGDVLEVVVSSTAQTVQLEGGPENDSGGVIIDSTHISYDHIERLVLDNPGTDDADIVVGPSVGGGPHVRTFDTASDGDGGVRVSGRDSSGNEIIAFNNYDGTLTLAQPIDELNVDLSGITGDIIVGPSESGSGVEVNGLGGEAKIIGVLIGRTSLVGDGDDTVSVQWPTEPNSSIHVAGVGTGQDLVRKRDIGTGAKIGSWAVLTSGLDQLVVQNTSGGHGEVSFDVPSLSGANSYIANLKQTDVAKLIGSDAANDNLVVGRYGNAWHPVGAEITQGGANVRVAGAGRLEVHTGGGDDTLVVDVDGTRGSDVVTLPIYFDGGDGGFDTLDLVGNPTTPVENMIYRPGPDTHNGRVEFDDADEQRLMTVEFTGLEPVRNSVVGQYHSVFGTDLSEDITYDTLRRGTGVFGGAPFKQFGRVTVDDKEAYFFQIENVTTTPGLLLYGEGGRDRFVIELPQRGPVDYLQFLTVAGESNQFSDDENEHNEVLFHASSAAESFEYAPHATDPDFANLYFNRIGDPLANQLKIDIQAVSDIVIPESGGRDTLQITGTNFNETLLFEQVVDATPLATGFSRYNAYYTETDLTFPGGANTLTAYSVKTLNANLGNGVDAVIVRGSDDDDFVQVKATEVTIDSADAVVLSNHDSVRVESRGGDDQVEIVNPILIDVHVDAGAGDDDTLKVVGRAASAEFIPFEDSRAGRLVTQRRNERERTIDYSGVDTLAARFENSDAVIFIYGDDDDNDITIDHPGIPVVNVDNRTQLQLFDLGTDARMIVDGRGGADRFATSLSDWDIHLSGGRGDAHDAVTIYAQDLSYQPDATFTNGRAVLQLGFFDEIIVDAQSLVANSNDAAPSVTYRTAGTNDPEARAFAFVTPGAGPGLPIVRLLGADASTPLNDPDLPSNQNGGVIAVSGGGLEAQDNLFWEVTSSDGQAVTDFKLFSAIVAAEEFTEETEPNDSITDENTVAIDINNDHRVARRGAVPFGDTDLIAIDINNDHRIAAIHIDINNDHSTTGTLTHSVLEILDSDGETVLASGSNIVGSRGNAAVTNALPEGKYYIRISNENPNGDGAYELVIFDVNDDFAVSTDSQSSFGADLKPGQHGEGSIAATPGENDVVELTPLGNKKSILRFNDATPLTLRDVNAVGIDPRGGDDLLRIFGSQDSDTIGFVGNDLAVNNQQFSHSNFESFAVLAGAGSDVIAVTRSLPVAGSLHIDGADGNDRLIQELDGANARVMLPGVVQDSRLLTSLSVEQFSLQGTTDEFGTATNIVASGAADASGAVTATPLTADRVNIISDDLNFDLTTTGNITISSVTPSMGSELPIRHVNVEGTVFDDTINITSTEVGFAGLSKTVGLFNIPSISIDGGAGLDTFNVTPSATTAVRVNGGDPIGFGDLLNITTTAGTVASIPGPTGDSGGYDIAGMKPVSFVEIENVVLPSIPKGIQPPGPIQNPLPQLAWNAVIDVVRYDVEIVNLTAGGIVTLASTEVHAFQPQQPLGLGSYEFRVRGYYESGDLTEWSEPVAFEIQTQPRFFRGQFKLGSRPEIHWQRIAGATRYDVMFTYDTGEQGLLLRDPNVTTNSFTPDSDLPLGDYTAWVRPFTEDNYGGTWASTSIRLNSPPMLLNPIGGTFSTTPTLRWAQSSPSLTYELWVRQTAPVQVDRVVELSGVRGTSVSLTTPLAEGEYEWWVRATEANGFKSKWSEAGSFNTLARTTVTGPTGTTSLSPIITWKPVPDATRYRVWVEDDTGRRVAHTTGATGPSFVIPRQLAAGTEHTVWVMAFMAATNGEWSHGFKFTTSPDRPVVLDPAGTVDDSTPTFNWTASKGAVGYELWVDNETNRLSRVIHDASLATNAYTPSTALSAGDYRAWVRAIHSDGTPGIWSAAVSFTVADSTSSDSRDAEDSVLPNVFARILTSDASDQTTFKTQRRAEIFNKPHETASADVPDTSPRSKHAATGVVKTKTPLANEQLIDSTFTEWDHVLIEAEQPS